MTPICQCFVPQPPETIKGGLRLGGCISDVQSSIKRALFRRVICSYNQTAPSSLWPVANFSAGHDVVEPLLSSGRTELSLRRPRKGQGLKVNTERFPRKNLSSIGGGKGGETHLHLRVWILHLGRTFCKNRSYGEKSEL